MSRRRNGGKRRTHTRRPPRKLSAALAIGLVIVGATGSTWRILAEREAKHATAEFIASKYRGDSDVDYSRFPGKRPWRYTYVATDPDGIPTIAAAGEIVWRGDECIHGGRILAGEILVNPASSAMEVESYVAEAADREQVGRLGRADGREIVELPDGSTGAGNFLAWFKPDAFGDGVCDQLPLTLQTIIELKPHESFAGRGEVDVAILEEDTRTGIDRWVGKWSNGGENTRPEISIGAETVSITVRKTDADGPSIAMATMHLYWADAEGMQP